MVTAELKWAGNSPQHLHKAIHSKLCQYIGMAMFLTKETINLLNATHHRLVKLIKSWIG